MPTFKYRGRPLVYFAAAKKHLSLYGLPWDRHQAELAAFDCEKGTIRFQPQQPPPQALVRTMLRERMADIDATLTSSSKKRRIKSA
jgi:uncharacterized protein YdhG (YjbR/CyaY superfamily)